MNNNLIKGVTGALVLSLILIFSGQLMAEDNNAGREIIEGQITDILESKINLENDYAHKWMKTMFGDYIFQPFDKTGVIFSGETTILTEVIAFTNVLALILGVIIISYTMIGGALASASSGEVLGKSWSSLWVPLRTAVGLGLIMPISIGGKAVLSAAQIAVIWLIILGSNAATILWNHSVDLMFGNETPANQSGELKRFIASNQVVFDASNIAKIVDQLACTEAHLRFASNNQKINNSQRSVNSRTIAIARDKDRKEVGRLIADMKYPANTNQFTIGRQDFSKLFNNPNALIIQFGGITGNCGEIRKSGTASERQIKNKVDYVNEELFGTDNNNASYKEIVEIAASNETFNQLSKTYNELLPVALAITYHAKRIYANEFPYPETGLKPFGVTIERALADPDEDYYSMLLNYFDLAKVMTSIAIRKAGDNFVKEILNKVPKENHMAQKISDKFKEGGWMMAGTWYHELAASQDIIQRTISDVVNNSIVSKELSLNLYQCKSKEGFFTDDDSCQNVIDEYDVTKRTIASLFREINAVSVSPESDLQAKVDQCKRNINDCDIPENVGSKFGARYAKNVLNTLASDYTSDDPVDEQNGSLASPFRVLSSIGHISNTFATTAYLVSGAVYSRLFAIEDVRPGSLLGTNTGFLAVAIRYIVGLGKFIISQIVIIGTIMISMGFLLAYLIPFLPLLTWILMVCGYLLTVIEAVVAAPLAVIMMVVPEGDGISGSRLERAMQMMLAVIMKPSLMIIGLIASITMSYVAFDVLNTMFWRASSLIIDIHQIRTSDSWLSAPTTGVLDFFAIFVIYVMLAYQICQYVVGVMHKLSEQIMEWFAGGMARSFGENDVGQSTQTAMGSIQTGFSKMTGGASGSISDLLKDRKQKLQDRMKANDLARDRVNRDNHDSIKNG
ncbi:DotA/TraY family protein [Endozoicomonas acroporae]|uniref:DotA/TraY family protein n=1 Tax=Endozoicomonas acroporae TaxID=1701104 RepID=UPI003D794B6C